MSRYKKLFKEMKEKNKELYDEFTKVHKVYEETNGKNRKEFNEIGDKFMKIVEEYIDDLCRTSESAGYRTNKLSDYFMTEVRGEFPSIDDVGVEVE